MTATLEASPPSPPPPPLSPPREPSRRKPPMSQKTRQERNLGWNLVAPAFLVMLAVVLYPILNALYLSLFSYRLTDASARSLIWFTNYRVILTDSAWWDAVWVSTIVMVASIVIEFPLGLALAMVMNKVVIPRRTLRTVVLIPYSIITVVSAYGWQYAFQPSSGFISPWLHDITFGAFNSQYDWFGHHRSALAAIMFSEVWKTTPFMSLLLLAGLAQVPGEPSENLGCDGHHGGPAVPGAFFSWLFVSSLRIRGWATSHGADPRSSSA
jgi:multiple sugar transport system permease protein